MRFVQLYGVCVELAFKYRKQNKQNYLCVRVHLKTQVIRKHWEEEKTDTHYLSD